MVNLEQVTSRSTPAGVAAISRGLSKATPPEQVESDLDPGRGRTRVV
jgi:hypothetical protein